MFNFFKSEDPVVKTTATELPKPVCDFENLDRLMRVFKEQTGIEFGEKRSIFKNKVSNFARNNGLESIAECIEQLERDGALKQELIDALTTNETYFFREMGQIKELVAEVKNDYGRVDILCAPGSTGEEPYTIAMELLEAGVAPDKFHITGIDINAHAIEFARRACYREKSLRKTPYELKQKYFTPNNDLYCLDETVKAQASMRVINVFDPEFKRLGKFDYIFSRNMLIYFDHGTKKRVKELLESMLKDGSKSIYFGHADLF